MKFNRKKYIATTFGITVLLSSCFKPLSESHIDDEIGFNGNFEHFQNSLPTNWLVNTVQTTEQGDFEIVADQKESVVGNQSLLFNITSCSPKGGRFSPGIAKELKVEAGETYKISFHVKNQDTRFSAKIRAVNVMNGDEGLSLNSEEQLTEWKRFEYLYKIPKKMKRLRFEFSVLSPGKCWIDAIQIKKVEK